MFCTNKLKALYTALCVKIDYDVCGRNGWLTGLSALHFVNDTRRRARGIAEMYPRMRERVLIHRLNLLSLMRCAHEVPAHGYRERSERARENKVTFTREGV